MIETRMTASMVFCVRRLHKKDDPIRANATSKIDSVVVETNLSNMVKPTVQQGDANGQGYLGFCYLKGYGVAKDKAAAEGCLCKAA